MNTDVPLLQLPRIAARFCALERAQWWTAEAIGRHADARLRDLVRHAARHVPYYRELFHRIGLDADAFRGRVDLPRIPPLDKETLRRRHAEFIADNAAAGHPVPSRTSGSTGTPLPLLLDRASCVNDAAATLRGYGWAGYWPWLTTAFWSRSYRQDWRMKYRLGGRCLGHDPHYLDRDFIPEHWREINRLRPAVFNGYPYTLVLLAELAREAGLAYHRPRTVICVGETLVPALRARLEELYDHPRIFNMYSLTENCAMIADCPRGHLHAWDDFAFHEFVDPAGTPVDEGPCEILGTAYFSHAMPLIRYRTLDLARVRPAAWRCACGRAFRGVEAIEGRREDSLRTPDGRIVSAIRTVMHFGRGIAASQMIQERLDHLTVNILPGPDFEPASLADLERGLRARLGDTIAIEFRTVTELEHRPGDSGKIPFVISRIAPSLYDRPDAAPVARGP